MRIGAAALVLMVLVGCATPGRPDGARFLVVRHAEKADATRDPGLSGAGRDRALALASRVDGEDLVAAYTTAYRRTRQTLLPTAQARGLDLVTYDAGEPAEAFAARLRAAHPRGAVLVAGHSNTVPAIVSALCGCPSAPMGEQEFDRLSVVRIAADGRTTLSVERYGAPSSE